MRALWLSIVVVGCVISGCSGDMQYTYSKQGTSSQQRAKDHYECRQASLQPSLVGIGGGLLVGATDPDWTSYRDCLQARGYTVKMRP
jgi:hypothetical protein